ncbi:DUF4232 domain-containing protein [Lentzea sp. NPDC051838]|uniref:DUF4232 domain-containing protein n=1 Tax=Lentzea sp. NPDC051838 TaxID=3154849 RepID=UPI003417E4AE
MNKTIAGVGIAALLTAAALPLLAGTASANPSDKPCDTSDLVVSVTKDPTSAAGQQAYVIHYVAAGPHTNCSLVGAPTAVTFTKGSGHSQADGSTIQVVLDDPYSVPAPVNVQPGKPAESRILMASQAPVTFQPSVVNLNLPVAGGGYTVTVGWPEGMPLRGDHVELTNVSPA